MYVYVHVYGVPMVVRRGNQRVPTWVPRATLWASVRAWARFLMTHLSRSSPIFPGTESQKRTGQRMSPYYRKFSFQLTKPFHLAFITVRVWANLVSITLWWLPPTDPNILSSFNNQLGQSFAAILLVHICRIHLNLLSIFLQCGYTATRGRRLPHLLITEGCLIYRSKVFIWLQNDSPEFPNWSRTILFLSLTNNNKIKIKKIFLSIQCSLFPAARS